jgi:hypothetical protein
MASSGTLRFIDLVRPDVSEERSASFIRVTRIGEIGTTLSVISNRRLLFTASVFPDIIKGILVFEYNLKGCSIHINIYSQIVKRLPLHTEITFTAL